MRFLLTTDPGLEDLVVEEWRELSPGAEARIEPYGHPGEVRVEADAADALLRLGTIHHVTELRAETEASTLEDVRRAVREMEFDELASAASFRVTSTCRGETTLAHRDVQGAAGAVLQKRHGTPVDLKGFAVEVCVDLYGRTLVAGLRLTRDSLGNRVRRGKSLRSSLKPTIATAMLRLAGAHRGAGRLIDPMCGAAVIPVEAARGNPALEVSGSDWDAETVEIARGTLRNHGLEIPVGTLDARTLGDRHEAWFDYIVTDPPHGLRQAKRTHTSALYRSLLDSFARALRPGGRLVLVVVKHRAFRAAVERGDLRILHERTVHSGGVHFRIFVLAR